MPVPAAVFTVTEKAPADPLNTYHHLPAQVGMIRWMLPVSVPDKAISGRNATAMGLSSSATSSVTSALPATETEANPASSPSSVLPSRSTSPVVRNGSLVALAIGTPATAERVDIGGASGKDEG